MSKIFIVLIVALGVSHQAGAWGVANGMFTPEYGSAYLARTVIEKRPLKYCLEIEDGAVISDRSLNQQLLLAFSIFRGALSSGRNLSTFERVNCDGNEHQVRVRLGSNSRSHRGMLGFAQPQIEAERAVMQIGLNTSVTMPIGVVPLTDSLSFFGGSIDRLKTAIGRVGDIRTAEPFQFTSRHRLDHTLWAASSWPTLLHEVGHAFGLCDTYSQENFDEQVHPDYRGGVFGFGAMMGQGYANLGPDDVQGLAAVKRAVTQIQNTPLPPPPPPRRGLFW